MLVAIKRGDKSGSAVRELGCSADEARAYVESLWKPGMSWANWGMGAGKWQLDHVKPLSTFDLSDQEQLRQACHYSNLQPLWHEEHVEKSRREGVLSNGERKRGIPLSDAHRAALKAAWVGRKARMAAAKAS